MNRMLSSLAMLVTVCFAHSALAAVIFQDDLDGTTGASIAGTTPETGGGAWAIGGVQPDQFFFAAGGGVEDAGPNSTSTNSSVTSTLTSSFTLSSLAAGEVLHLRVTMKNISSTPATNVLESSRVDLLANTSGGAIYLGELDTGGNWGANSQAGFPIASDISTAQSGPFVLDLYLDPTDAFGDGPDLNAMLIVNGSYRKCGTIDGLSTSTTVSAVRLLRNVDDEVFFDDLSLETIPAPSWIIFYDDLAGTPGASIVGTTPETGGNAWTQSGVELNSFFFASGGGVEDAGPNSMFTNAIVTSTLPSPFSLTSLVPCEVLHLRVTMKNISSTPVTNPLQSSRVDLVTNTSGGFIYLGELHTGGHWGANSNAGIPLPSDISAAQSGPFVLDLYLDPNDQMDDGPSLDAAVVVNGGPARAGRIEGLTSGTTISAVRLVRNIDDEVFFEDLFLEKSCQPELVDAVPALPEWGLIVLMLSLSLSGTCLVAYRMRVA